MGNSSDIDTSIAALYRAWRLFRPGKRASRAIIAFEYNLEAELARLAYDIEAGAYQHGAYEYFEVNDSKRRMIAVATVRDRVVHRLLYEYLMPLYDRTFVYDVWSCRPGKGLHGAVRRTQRHMQAYRDGWLWRSDIRKFFDSIDHEVLQALLRRRVTGRRALWLLDEVIESYSSREQADAAGVAIGNLTSQILGNIYLHEYDFFVSHMLKPLGYVRYGDDMVLWTQNEDQARELAEQSRQFLTGMLHVTLNPGSTVLQPVSRKLHYLGMEFWPSGHRLDSRMRTRLRRDVSVIHFASYDALARARGTTNDRHALRQSLLLHHDI